MTEAGPGPASASPPGPGPAAASLAAPVPAVASRGSTLGLRLALAFLSVALAAVALLAGLTATLAAADVSALTSQQRADLTSAIAAAAAAAWDRGDSWASADLSPVLDLATRTGAEVQIRDQASRVVIASPGFAGQATAPQQSATVVVSGDRVGQAVVRFTNSGLASADHVLQRDLLQAIFGAAGLAAVLALLTGLAMARRISRPVERIIAVTRAMGHGERTARVGDMAAPSELRELATAFDQLADTRDRQDQLRRDLVADIAHELRTPVAVLQAGHEALLDGITEPTPDQLGSLRDEVLRLARMVGDLQTLAAADAAGLHLIRRPCDLAGLAASTPVVVFGHVPLWAVYSQWGWGTQDGHQALSYLKRFGSVTVLNGHIHQIAQKVEGNMNFHTARSTGFPQPAPGQANGVGVVVCPGGGVPHCTFPSPNKDWNRNAELSCGIGVPLSLTPFRVTSVLAICRVPFTSPKVFTTLSIWA